jgi:hypothetical protein
LYSDVLSRHCTLCWFYCCCCCCRSLNVIRRRRLPAATEAATGGERSLSASDGNGGVRLLVTGFVDGSAVGGTGSAPTVGEGHLPHRDSCYSRLQSHRCRLFLDVEYCHGGWDATDDNGRRRGVFVSGDSVSSSPGPGRSSAFPMTSVSCVELTRVDSTLTVTASCRTEEQGV